MVSPNILVRVSVALVLPVVPSAGGGADPIRKSGISQCLSVHGYWHSFPDGRGMGVRVRHNRVYLRAEADMR